MAQTDFMSKLNRVNTAKSAIKTAIEEKGQQVSNNIEDFAEAIGNISGETTDNICGSTEYYEDLQLSKRFILPAIDYTTQHILDDAIYNSVAGPQSTTVQTNINQLDINLKLDVETLPVIEFTQAEKQIIYDDNNLHGGTCVLAIQDSQAIEFRKQIQLVYRIGYDDIQSEDAYISLNASIVHVSNENVYVSEDIWEYQDSRWWSEASRLVYNGPGWYSIELVDDVYQLDEKWLDTEYETASTNLSNVTNWQVYYRNDFSDIELRDKILNNLCDIMSTIVSFDFTNQGGDN